MRYAFLNKGEGVRSQYNYVVQTPVFSEKIFKKEKIEKFGFYASVRVYTCVICYSYINMESNINMDTI